MRSCLLSILAAVVIGLVLAGGAPKAASDQAQIPFPEVPRLSKETLKEKLGTPGVVVLDCRPEEQWNQSEQKIPGAVHEDPLDVKSWAHKYPKDTAIFSIY